MKYKPLHTKNKNCSIYNYDLDDSYLLFASNLVLVFAKQPPKHFHSTLLCPTDPYYFFVWQNSTICKKPILELWIVS